MKQLNAIETFVGAVVLLVAVGFLVYAYTQSGAKIEKGYTLKAQFQRIDGLRVGADVRLGGVKVGTVLSLTINATNFMPVVSFTVKEVLKLSQDTKVRIISATLFGEKYLDISPGGAETTLVPNEVIYETQDAINFEDLLGKTIFQTK